MLRIGSKRLSQFRAAGFVCMCQYLFQRSKFIQQLGRCFGAHARHARDIVRAVAHQSLEVCHELRINPHLLLYRLGIHQIRIRNAALCVQDLHRPPYQLQSVLIARYQQRLAVILLGQLSHRAQYIVRFVSLTGQYRNAQFTERLFQKIKLRDQLFRCLFSSRFIVLILQMAERRRL